MSATRKQSSGRYAAVMKVMNTYHRWYCRSAKRARQLEKTVLPRVVRDYDPGTDVFEIGPGPGLVTDLLRQGYARVTCIEIDEKLARSLDRRMAGLNVEVHRGDATAMPFGDASFSAAISMTMLHHVPSAEPQDRLLAETCRVLRPGGVFVGCDCTVSLKFRLSHVFDTMVLVPPETFAARLEAAGFTGVAIRPGKGSFRFRAKKPD
jgi:SAM-dependent methyltransferase